ncbi:MAG: hypothetical protein Q8919_12825, partial [Bacteroidota bacterium]|nr:hypothetical protein [Bacteroidota bacterium]
MAVTDLDFFSDSIGIVCSVFGEVLLTYDQGTSWKKLNANGYNAVNFAGTSKKILLDQYYSNDGGNTWNQAIPVNQIQCIRFNKNTGLCYAINYYGSNLGNLYESKDSGYSWVKLPSNFDGDSYSFAFDSCESNGSILIANEDCVAASEGNPNGLGEVFVTTDNGNSWSSHFAKPVCHISGSIAIGRRAVFCPTQSDVIYRSIDKGNTWVPIGGPSSPVDTRMIAAVNDNVIVAADAQGGVWITYNSGGVPIPPPTVMPFVQSPHLKPISACSQSFDSIILMPRQDCGSTTTITNFSLGGKDSALFSLSVPQIPLLLSKDTGLKETIRFTPNGSTNSDTAIIQIHGYYLTSSDSIAFDTTIIIIGKTIPVPPKLLADNYSVSFGTLSTCLPPLDTTVTLTNKGCDSLQIISGPGVLAPEFTLLTPLTLPLTLPPDSSVALNFRFKPSGTAPFFSTATFTASQQTLTQDISIYLRGEGSKDVGVLSYVPTRFNFPNTSICSHDSASGLVANIGCDSIGLDASQILGDPDYRVSGVTTPVTEKPGDTIRYSVYLDPAKKGVRLGRLVLHSYDGVKFKLDTIPFAVTVTDGTRILASSLASCDFGATTPCNEKDTAIRLSNTGCDTLMVYSAAISGSGFIVTGIGDSLMILPGTDTVIYIHSVTDTTGGKQVNSGTLNFVTNADDTLSPILLTHRLLPMTQRNIGLYLDAIPKTGVDLSSVTYDIKEALGSSFTGAGIKKIDLALAYNTDLLNFNSLKSSPNLTTSDGKSFTITGIPEVRADASGVLASIAFTVYLSKDSTTTIDLKTVLIDSTPLPCTNLILSYSGSATFDYQFLCGERSLAGFMK